MSALRIVVLIFIGGVVMFIALTIGFGWGQAKPQIKQKHLPGGITCNYYEDPPGSV